MRREDWTLLTISAAKDHGLSPVQLQKSLFLLGKRLPRQDIGAVYYEFEPYNYGPFDVRVYQDAEALARRGLVTIVRTPERRWATYRVTPAGIEEVAGVKRAVSPRALDYLDKVIRWVSRLSFRDLVKAIYTEFPEFRANSVFQG